MDHSIKYQKFAYNTVIIGPILSIDYITKTAKLSVSAKEVQLRTETVGQFYKPPPINVLFGFFGFSGCNKLKRLQRAIRPTESNTGKNLSCVKDLLPCSAIKWEEKNMSYSQTGTHLNPLPQAGASDQSASNPADIPHAM